MLEITEPKLNLGKKCESVLRDLPEWFGIEQAIVKYCREIDGMPTIAAMEQGELIGFVTMNILFEKSADLHVLAVKKSHHRLGVGRELFQATEKYLNRIGVRFVQVKTISENSADLNYAKTRSFYLAMGYTPLEEFPELWDKHNPCLQMIKYI
jgi:GNAT superfamily N-acetyltransferase